jgi:hypothetical protein
LIFFNFNAKFQKSVKASISITKLSSCLDFGLKRDVFIFFLQYLSEQGADVDAKNDEGKWHKKVL